MGMNAALVDRARVLRKTRTGQKVGGRPRRTPSYGPWFKCRLRTSETQEQRDEARTKYRARPNFMAAKRDELRGLVELNGGDEIEVESKEFGNAKYRLDGDPKIIRKRRGVHHVEGVLVRISEGEHTAGAETTPTEAAPEPTSKAVPSGQHAVVP